MNKMLQSATEKRQEEQRERKRKNSSNGCYAIGVMQGSSWYPNEKCIWVKGEWEMKQVSPEDWWSSEHWAGQHWTQEQAPLKVHTKHWISKHSERVHLKVEWSFIKTELLTTSCSLASNCWFACTCLSRTPANSWFLPCKKGDQNK